MAGAAPAGFVEAPLRGWRVPERYTVDREIGGGSYSIVASAEDAHLQKRVAIKRLSDPLINAARAKYTFREIMLLRHVGGNDLNSIVRLFDIFSPQSSPEELQDIYIVTELFEQTFRDLLSNPPAEWTPEHAVFFMYRLLVGIRYLASANVTHRDLKPENIGILGGNEETGPILKIIDFGLARVLHNEEGTPDMQTLFYRAPEVILQLPESDKADMWSFGCILVECYTRRILFQTPMDFPATPYRVFRKMVETLGAPSLELMSRITSDHARNVFVGLLNEIQPGVGNFRQIAPEIEDECLLDLLSHLLVYDPRQRYSAAEALEHPYFERYRAPDEFKEEEEPLCLPFDEHISNANIVELDEWKRHVFQQLCEIAGNVQALPPQ
eukprot:m.94622 g.94622  ORF g.94622 m.94622 type:complete len:383 (+) comp8717_c0_seq4:56-1204(+)